MNSRKVFRKAKAISKGMNKSGELSLFSHISNRRLEQVEQLYMLCEEDFNILMQLQARIKKHFIFYTPATRKEVAQILNMKI